MDSVTHSIVAVSVAEMGLQFRFRKVTEISRSLRYLYWLVGLVAGNIQDLDVFLAPLSGGRLGYLLHRRGITHGVASVLPEVLFLLFALWVGTRIWGTRLGRRDWWWLIGISAINLLVHLVLDAMNSYGVHWLWPFDSRWFYGDMLFIVEPWVWVCILPMLFLAEAGFIVRLLFAALFLMVISLCWFSGYVPWSMSLVVMVSGLGLWWLSRRLSERMRAIVGLLCGLCVVGLFAGFSRQVRERLKDYHAEFETTQLEDVVLTPLPANPFCWAVLSVESYSEGKQYRVRKGYFAPVQVFYRSSDCLRYDTGPGTAPLSETAESRDPHLVWTGEYRGSVETLRDLRRTHCVVAAFLRFARVPFVVGAAGDLVVGDLRFDRNPGLGFAEMQISRLPARCPGMVLNWEEPRLDFFAAK